MNINEIDIKTNGFVSEFRKAQANLQANIAAGRGATFAYTGAPGTSPLPIFLAYFNGSRRGPRRRHDGVHRHQLDERDVPRIPRRDESESVRVRVALQRTTNGFVGNATFRNNAAAAGLPSNFFLANPDILGGTGSSLTTNFGGTRANSVQVEFRKRLSSGIAFNTSYTWSDAFLQQRYGFQKPLRGDRPGRPGRQRAARGEGQLDLRAAVRQGPALGQQRQRLPGRAHRRVGD